MTTPESTNAQVAPQPELLCILEMLSSMKRHLVLHGTTDPSSDPSSGIVQWNYSAHRRVLKYLFDYVDEAELRNLKNYTGG